MAPKTKRRTQRVLLRALVALTFLIAMAGISQSQTAATCSQLSVHREGTDAAMGGRRSLFYSFKNNSQKPCTLTGWPGYVLLNNAGHPLKAQNMAGEGVPDDPKPVTLAPGGKAFFSVNYTTCSSPGHKRCMSSAKARITAPGTKRAFIIREVINVEGPTFDGAPMSGTLEELGISIEKRKP